ncbi:MAG: alpha/beta fold hydrolase [Patescibacteria group bacterium]|nr:alpha/beta fold hydrolase [Patescibacteria group bacterium]
MIIDTIVPCYNEEPRVGGVLTALNKSPLVKKIIFVDGGSTDNSVKIARNFNKVKIVALKKRGGKGQDVRQGLNLATRSAIFLCDADLIGLKENHVRKMVEAYEKNPKGLVVGLTQKNNLSSYHWIRANFLPLISGMRVISKNDLIKVLDSPLADDYGIEPYMNYYFFKKRQPVIKVLLDGVNDLPKPQKGHGWKLHLAEASNLVGKYVNIYGTQMPRDFLNGLRNYWEAPAGRLTSNYRPKNVIIKGLKINYVRVGAGRPLVLIHGWANNWEGWVPVIKYLKKDFTLYLLDLPGFGDSGDLPVYSIESAANYVGRFLTAVSESPVILCGLSMGSLVAAETAKRFPNSISKLILAGPVMRGQGIDLAGSAVRYSLWLFKKFSLGESTLKKIIETRLAAYAMSKYINMYKFNRFLVDAYGLIGKKKMRKEAFTQMGISAAGYDLAGILKSTDTETLLLYGREDKISSPNFAREKILPENSLVRLKIIEKAGHVVPLEQPKEAAKAIKEFANV